MLPAHGTPTDRNDPDLPQAAPLVVLGRPTSRTITEIDPTWVSLKPNSRNETRHGVWRDGPERGYLTSLPHR